MDTESRVFNVNNDLLDMEHTNKTNRSEFSYHLTLVVTLQLVLEQANRTHRQDYTLINSVRPGIQDQTVLTNIDA